MAKGDVNIDAIHDAALDSSVSSASSSEPGNTSTSSAPGLDMARLLNNPYNMPNPFMPLLSPSGLPMALPSLPNDPVQNNMKNLYEESLKKYLNDLSGATHLPKPTGLENIGLKSPVSSSNPHLGSRNHMRLDSDDAPLDLSKPVKASSTPVEKTPEVNRARLSISTLEVHRSRGDHSPRFCMEQQDARSETLSESTENNEDSLLMGSNPPSPNSSTSSLLTPSARMAANKRFRTQMSSTQIKVMKNLFQEYKTPTMSECEMLGNMIGLAKRVVQVWFQNARAKEKKHALTYNKPYDGDFQRPPDKCKLCNFKYSHKYTIQDHIFTKRHIEQVRSYVQSQSDAERDYTHPDAATHQLMQQRELEEAQIQWTPGTDSSLVAHPHLAQLHAMGLQAMGLSGRLLSAIIFAPLFPVFFCPYVVWSGWFW